VLRRVPLRTTFRHTLRLRSFGAALGCVSVAAADGPPLVRAGVAHIAPKPIVNAEAVTIVFTFIVTLHFRWRRR
jgi:hypothetical protein